MTTRIGARGRITIERSIRAELDILAGDEVVQRIEGQRIVLDVIPRSHSRSLAGVLRGQVGRVPTDETWSVLRRRAWEAPSDLEV
jgi:bifunctional DNA-binding transcriptional regulator/antitoxin component of YhaV-PrlF toxin-antitoxin module